MSGNETGKRLEQLIDEINKSKARLNGIMHATPIGICITNEDAIFEDVNPAYCKTYGYKREELIGKKFTIVVPEEHHEYLLKLHDEFMGKQYELDGEWQVVNKQGELLTILANAAYIIDYDGKPKKVTYVIDISKRKQLEQELEMTVASLQQEIEERKRLEQMKEDVQRILRHDLKTPLTAIIGYSEYLMMKLSDDREVQEVLGEIYQSGFQMVSMIDNSLNLYKIETGTYKLEPTPIDLIELQVKLMSDLSFLAESNGVTMSLTVEGEPLTDQTDSICTPGEMHLLESLFANLARNAIEAAPEGTGVHIDVYRVDEKVEVKIHNSGIIPGVIREKFFEKYATHGKHSGTGLGTYSAKLITEAHSGSIRFTTSEDEGTTLFVLLPHCT
jgi:PAS domain S-box-containing protein